VYHRADAQKEHMGLTSWKDAPQGKIQKFDVSCPASITLSGWRQLGWPVLGYA